MQFGQSGSGFSECRVPEMPDALAPSRLNQGSFCNPGTTGTEAEARKIEKYSELLNNGYISRPAALEVQGSLCESSEVFITRLYKMLCRSHDDQ